MLSGLRASSVPAQHEGLLIDFSLFLSMCYHNITQAWTGVPLLCAVGEVLWLFVLYTRKVIVGLYSDTPDMNFGSPDNVFYFTFSVSVAVFGLLIQFCTLMNNFSLLISDLKDFCIHIMIYFIILSVFDSELLKKRGHK